MARPKLKDGGKRVIFYLSRDERWLIDQMKNSQGFSSRSEFIGWLVRNFVITKDPVKELESLKEEQQRLKIEVESNENKQKQVIERMKFHNEDIKAKEQQKEYAIQNIKDMFNRGKGYLEIEEIARFWAFRLNVDKAELIFKAGIQIKEERQK